MDGTKRHARNVLSLDINNVVGTGNFGDVIRGSLNKQPSHVHVISGIYHPKAVTANFLKPIFSLFSTDDMEPLDQMQFIRDFSQIQKIGAHNNILTFYGVCQTADWLYLLFEDVPQTLKKRLLDARTPPNVNPQRFSSISEKAILQILCDIANAMEYLSMYEVRV